VTVLLWNFVVLDVVVDLLVDFFVDVEVVTLVV
jgi:hypothetical protein